MPFLKFFKICSFALLYICVSQAIATSPHEIFERLDGFSKRLQNSHRPNEVLVIHGELGSYIKSLPSYEILTRPDAATLALKDQNAALFKENKDFQARIFILENANSTLGISLRTAQENEQALQAHLKEAIQTLTESCDELQMQFEIKAQYVLKLQETLADKEAALLLSQEENQELQEQNHSLQQLLDEAAEKAPPQPRKRKNKAVPKPISTPPASPQKPAGFQEHGSPIKNTFDDPPLKPQGNPFVRKNLFGNSDEAGPSFHEDLKQEDFKKTPPFFTLFIAGKDRTRPALFATAGLVGAYYLRSFAKDCPSPVNPMVDLTVTILSGFMMPYAQSSWEKF